MRAKSKKETEAQRLARIAEQRKKQQIKITVPEEITVGDLAKLLRMTATEVIKSLCHSVLWQQLMKLLIMTQQKL